jgi:hypothetical protein
MLHFFIHFLGFFLLSAQEGLLDSLTFNNLTHLIVEEGLSHYADFGGLLWILKKCPCLNTLKFPNDKS